MDVVNKRSNRRSVVVDETLLVFDSQAAVGINEQIASESLPQPPFSATADVIGHNPGPNTESSSDKSKSGNSESHLNDVHKANGALSTAQPTDPGPELVSLIHECRQQDSDIKPTVERTSVGSFGSELSWKTARLSFRSRKSEGRHSISRSSYATARSYSSSLRESILSRQPNQQSKWKQFLEERNLLVDKFNELDWSGRGQHAEFQINEASEIPLKSVNVLGHTANAFVESVLCRRILLARKTINCHRRIKREDAIKEVEHLQRLKHTHIIQVVGTYTFARNLSILLYPVAEYNLDTFLEEIQEPERTKEFYSMEQSLRAFFGCLSSTLSFIHDALTKHLDIKPKNILVKDMGSRGVQTSGNGPINLRYKIIIADFGIARSYNSEEELETETPVSFTRAYAAHEVIAQERRGLAADVFSLGCVFAEMLATFANTTIESFRRRDGLLHWKCVIEPPKPDLDHCKELRNARIANEYGDISYQANLPEIRRCVSQACLDIYKYRDLLLDPNIEFSRVRDVMLLMLDPVPDGRPSATDLCAFFKTTAFLHSCSCLKRPEPFEATKEYESLV